jgi:hypothetical protein
VNVVPAAAAFAIPAVVKLGGYSAAARRLNRSAAQRPAPVLVAVGRLAIGALLGIAFAIVWAKLMHLPSRLQARDLLRLYAALLPARLAAWWAALQLFYGDAPAKTVASLTLLTYAIDAAIVGVALALGAVFFVGMIVTHIGTC